MATSTNLKPLNVSVRISRMHREKLWELLFSRYPENEWGSFIRFGWRESHYGLILTVNFIDAPLAGDIDTQSEVTEFKGQYTRRIIRGIDKHLFGVGVVHSHPEGYSTFPSLSDDNMEAYFANLFAGYIANRPFASLIFSKSGDIFSGSGRVWWKDNWYEVDRFIIENCPVRLNDFTRERRLSPEALKRTARLASQFSIESAEALADSTVAVMGLSGTGSPIVELLVRAGVGKFIVVDPKVFDDSNFERNHFSTKNDIGKGEPKSLIAKRFIKSLNPDCEVIAIQGSLPQEKVLDQILEANIVLGCTDLYSARVALTDISTRYLMPVIDVGVAMEGADGSITGQIVQVNNLFPGEPCVYCRRMISARLASQELMTDDEKLQRQTQASEAKKNGGNPDAYWIDTPQLNTVGYLTTIAGGLVAGFCIGFLTGRFSMPKNFLEINLSSKGTSIVEKNKIADSSCTCQKHLGCADQEPSAVLISAPKHWVEPIQF